METHAINDIDVLILAGGKGTRLRPVAKDRPKAMALIDDRPFLEILLGYLHRQGLERFILCTGYMSNAIESYFAHNNQSYQIRFSKENAPLDTGGAVKHAEALIKSNPFFVLNGDSFCEVDFSALLGCHRQHRALATMVVAETDTDGQYGRVELDVCGRISRFEEKSGAAGRAYASAGIYCMRKTLLAQMPVQKPFSLEKDFFPQLTQYRFWAYTAETCFWDIGTPARYARACQGI